MKIQIVSALTALLLTSAVANAQVKEVNGFQNPESVVACRDKLFVSNMGAALDPTAKDGDGYISMVSRKDGRMIKEKFITGLNSPKGLLVKHHKLYVTDVDKVLVFNTKTGEKLWEADLSDKGNVYVNDLAKRTWGGVYVSATYKNTIYKIKANGVVKEMKIKGDLPGANGLTKRFGRLYVANYGRGETPQGSFGRVGLWSKKYKELYRGGVYDGVVKVGRRLILTDWGTDQKTGRLVVYNLRTKELNNVGTTGPIDGPADLFADGKTKTVWVPAMKENKVIAVSYDVVKN